MVVVFDEPLVPCGFRWICAEATPFTLKCNVKCSVLLHLMEVGRLSSCMNSCYPAGLLQFPWTFVLPAFAYSIIPHPQRYSRPHGLPTSDLDITDVLQVLLVLDTADLDTIYTPVDI